MIEEGCWEKSITGPPPTWEKSITDAVSSETYCADVAKWETLAMCFIWFTLFLGQIYRSFYDQRKSACTDFHI